MGVVDKVISTCSKLIDTTAIKGMGIRNLRTINPHCISGSTLDGAADLSKVKKAGIDKIVDFRAEATPAFGKACEEKGIEYLNFPIFSTSKSSRKPTITKVDDKFFGQLKKYLSMVEEGNTYIGCQYGLDRTNVGVLTNYLLNPKAPVPKILSWDLYDKKSLINNLLNSVRRKIIKKLTPEQIKELGLPADYNKYLQQRIGDLLKENVYQAVG